MTENIKVVATNRKAGFEYFLLEKFEAGLVLQGSEIKSIRAGNVSFKDAFARIDEDEVFLYNLHITLYPQASYLNDEPDRVRKLLLNKREIGRLIGSVVQKNLLLVPTKLYFNKRGMVKVELAVGRGKKQYDKRETIKKRDIDRDISRVIRQKKR